MRLFIEAYGCALNKGEAHEMMESAHNCGHQATMITFREPGNRSVALRDAKCFDAVMLVTCTVIQGTENRMLSRLRELVPLGVPIIVAGCMASAQPELVLKVCPRAILLPPENMGELPGVLEKISGRKGGRPVHPVSFEKMEADVPIADGCLGACTYCITRLARGELRSRPVDDVVKRVRTVVGWGCREVNLTAQDCALYGRDIGRHLPLLLEKVRSIPGDFRIRVGMMNPENLLPMMDGLMKAFMDAKLFKFIHVPVQSGDDGILESMGRGYRATDFSEIVNRFRDAFPFSIISTDIIVGFPGEGEEQFRNTYRLLEETGPDIINVKIFSPRPGTQAARMTELVDISDSRKRTKALGALHQSISVRNNSRMVGRTEELFLMEKVRGGVMGRTLGYYPVILKERLEPGGQVRVAVREARKGYLLATKAS
jgi:threonylcarbamoyladenosine tRNA methylthiotransferase CDKAL1